ncbi:hypothetical protein N9988_00040 [bacterium]|jgi:hypothetical protein|nr:hypothetical protein [bacterium]
MKRITLLHRLKPEVKAALDSNKSEYDFSIDLIYKELDKAIVYQDLKMSTIYSIYLFSSIDMYEADVYDIRWGGNLFLEDNDLTIETL